MASTGFVGDLLFIQPADGIDGMDGKSCLFPTVPPPGARTNKPPL